MNKLFLKLLLEFVKTKQPFKCNVSIRHGKADGISLGEHSYVTSIQIKIEGRANPSSHYSESNYHPSIEHCGFFDPVPYLLTPQFLHK